MLHLVVSLGLVLAQGAAVRPSLKAGKQIYQVDLRPERRDYPLVAPARPGPCQVRISGGAAPDKSKLVFTSPLPAGRYTLDIRPVLPGDRTIVFSVPLRGDSTF